MKYSLYAVLAVAACTVGCVTPSPDRRSSCDDPDESDALIPDIVARAPRTVDVLTTGECFHEPIGTNSPWYGWRVDCWHNPDLKVRIIAGRVHLADFKLYGNRRPRFSDGLVAFRLDDKWGVCDGVGRPVISPRFSHAIEFHEGLAGVNAGDKHGFINKEGEWVIPPIFDKQNPYPWYFIGDVCPVRYEGKYAVINKKGAFIWEPGLQRSEELAGGVSIVTADGHEAFLDDLGRLIPDRKPNPHYFKQEQ